jgi:hypothetical protein
VGTRRWTKKGIKKALTMYFSGWLDIKTRGRRGCFVFQKIDEVGEKEKETKLEFMTLTRN